MTRSLPLLLLLLGACAPAPPPVAAPAPSAPAAAASTAGPDGALPLEIKWYRTSAEARGLYLQAFRAAGERLRQMRQGTDAAAPWGVVMDADETVLDNSLFEQRVALRHQSFSEDSFRAWIREEAGTALPGAVEFTRLVHELGGRVVIVTNRADELCPETRRNLQKVGIALDAVLCQRETSDKNPRFQQIQHGGVPGLPALETVMYFGDNIQDFPGLTQAAARAAPPSAFANFGRVWWLLPNPMYGSWTGNPVM
jgi:5'-nucleotidase (lipoprotein e(P4) family)